MSGGREVVGGLPKRRRLAPRFLLAALAAAATLALAEIALRVLAPRDWFLSAALLEQYEQSASAAAGVMTADAELGHVPVLGGRDYDADGLLRRGSPTTGRRVLFLGDSVTRRGRLVRSLASLAPETACLNAGVEAFNVVQEVGFYFRVVHRTRPEHVVLTLHNNDFTFTPVALWTADGFTMCAPGARASFSPALYRWSCLYRLYSHARSDTISAQIERRDLVAETGTSLRRLRDALAADGIGLSVLLLPILAPLSAWSGRELQAREQAIAMLQELGVPWIDLLAPLQQLLAAGAPVQEQDGDRWHPGDAAALAMAAHALEHGVFPGHPITARSDVVVLRGDREQTIRIDLGERCAGQEYRLLGSRTGTAPGLPVDGLLLPLQPDQYSLATFWQPETVFAPAQGRLDESGRAQVAVRSQPAAAASCSYHVAVALAGARVTAITNVVPLLRLP